MKDRWLYIITPFFLIVPILTYEGVIGWMIGLIGIYKCYTYEKRNIESKIKKSIQLLLVCWFLGAMHYLIVTNIQDIVLKLFM
ncbi:hypothetical protein CM240_0014 [Clostridium bornimense]|uniref:Uncharacterized protein n=1 Tax=Clostridium bornimense TaxID=1216932 RepID=W6RYU9_9CLOT|nr:hypothetical protein [Clostridium bornimense]CDM67207.1 hypothetical protein CM240_0014 [Clostridium bornimense]